MSKAFCIDRAIEAWGKHLTPEELTAYERLFNRRQPAPYALGDEPGLDDICVAGQVVGAHFLKIDLTEIPTVARLAARCFALTAFATSHPFQQPEYVRQY